MSLNAFLQTTYTDAQIQALAGALPPPATPDTIQDSLTTTKLSCAVAGTIEGFLPASTTQPAFKIGSDMSYLSCGDSPALSTAVVALTDGINLFKNSNRRMGILDTDDAYLQSEDQQTVLTVRDNFVSVSVLGEDRIQVGASNTTLASSNGIGTDYVNIDPNSFYVALASNPVIYCSLGNTRIWSPSLNVLLQLDNDDARIQRASQDRLVIDSSTSALIAFGHQVEANALGVQVDSLYTLPTTLGVAGQVLTRGAGLSTAWVTPIAPTLFGYSQTTLSTVANTTSETALSTVGAGSFQIPANTAVPGSSYLIRASGTFRDNANNTNIRFRLRSNGLAVFDTGPFALTNVNTVRAWQLELQCTYNGSLITNGAFTYRSGTNTMSGYSAQTTAAFNVSVLQAFALTVQWVVSSGNNTITCNTLTLSKLY